MPDPNIIEVINLNNVEYSIKDAITGALTTSDIATGTDTTPKFVSAKVISDAIAAYVASLDATDTSY